MELDPTVASKVKLTTQDIAIAGLKLDELALVKGGPALARHARKEVQKLEYRDVPVIEAIRRVYNLVAADKL